MDASAAAGPENDNNGWGQDKENAPYLITPMLLPKRHVKHMGQVLLKLMALPEPLSSSMSLHTLERKSLDPEMRSSVLANTLC